MKNSQFFSSRLYDITSYKWNSPIRVLQKSFMLFLLATFWIVFSASQVKARPATPCDCSSFTTIGSPNTNTNISSLLGGLASNTCYLIRGTLVINSSTYWDEMRLKMDEGSQILVSTELTVEDSYISGCDNMWKGIKTISAVNLSVFESAIESAEFAIYLGNFVGFHCKDNDFIDNYIGIAVGSPFDADQFDYQVKQKGMITGCKFYTNTVVPDPYPGQYITRIGLPHPPKYLMIRDMLRYLCLE